MEFLRLVAEVTLLDLKRSGDIRTQLNLAFVRNERENRATREQLVQQDGGR